MGNKYSININCSTTEKQLGSLYNFLDGFRSKYGTYKRMTETEEKIFTELNELYNKEELKFTESMAVIEEFFKTKLGKYWKMKITRKSSNHEYVEEYVLYPYEFIEPSGTFFAVMSNNIRNHYELELKDNGVTLEWFFRGDMTIEMEEITKEEFLETEINCVKDILYYRLIRLKEKKESKG